MGDRTDRLRILQIGAGSMGTRRLRDLTCRPDVEFGLLEIRADRRRKAALNHPSLALFEDLEASMAWKPDALCILTPPDDHERFIHLALDRALHHFCEANIWTADPDEVESVSKSKALVSAPSNSLYFLPIVQELRLIVHQELGTLHSCQVTLNTYMPDWHPGEGGEYYARHRNTAAGREMVPFELLWMNQIFGPAKEVCGTIARCGDLPVAGEDVWSLQMTLAGGGLAQLLVTMGTPSTLRQGWCAGTAGQVTFDLLSGRLTRSFRNRVDDVRDFGSLAELSERTYRREIDTFVDAIQGKGSWPQTYRATASATATLASAEASAKARRPKAIEVHRQPENYDSR